MPDRSSRIAMGHLSLVFLWVVVWPYLPALLNGLLIVAMTGVGIWALLATRPPIGKR